MFEKEETLKIMLKGVSSINDAAALKEKINEVDKQKRNLIIKFGLDPSAPDIHLGHAVALRKIKALQNLGHRACIIIGDFTGMIGDPTGKSKTRNQLSEAQVRENAETYVKQIFEIIDESKTTVLYNSDWYKEMKFPEIIELCSKATVARILERDDFAKRYKTNSPIAMHEFFYPMMQAYDSVVCKADIEMGGTDQTFNILMGRNVQKDYGISAQVPLFVPLLEGIDGVEKMSKSLGNYIGIKESANSMFEKTMKVPDNLIIRYFELATDEHPDKIATMKELLTKGQINPRDLKMALARTITALYHTVSEVKDAEDHFVSIYQKKEAPKDIEVITFNDSEVTSEKVNLVDQLAKTGKFKSKSEIRRNIQFGGMKIDGERFIDLEIDKRDEYIVQVGKGTMLKLKYQK